MDESETKDKPIGRYVDLGLSKDKKPMLFGDYVEGKRWGWLEEKSNRFQWRNKNNALKEKYETKQTNSSRKASKYIEMYAKFGESKSIKNAASSLRYQNKQTQSPELTDKNKNSLWDKIVGIGTTDEIYTTGDVGFQNSS